MRNISDKILEKIKTHILYSMVFFFENRGFYEMKWKNIEQPDRLHRTICRMRIACWIPKATNTHSEYVILIAFQLQQWSHERPSMLHYTHIACFLNR